MAEMSLVRDAKEHGVTVLPADVNYSDWDSTLEPEGDGFSLRLGMRQIGGFRADAAARIMAARDAPYRDLEDLKTRAGITAAHVRRLAEADAMRSMFIDRRQALWEAKGLRAPDVVSAQKHGETTLYPHDRSETDAHVAKSETGGIGADPAETGDGEGSLFYHA